MAAASAEPHPSSPTRPPSLSPAPKLLPRDKQTRRQGRPLPPPRSPPTPRPGPVRAPASELRLQPQPQPARARARGGGGSRGSSSLPPAPGTSGPTRIRRRVLGVATAAGARRGAPVRAAPGRPGAYLALRGPRFGPTENFPYLKGPRITPPN